MAVRSGSEYLRDLDRTKREIWIGGRRVGQRITDHPAFSGIAKSMAALYDMQTDPGIAEEMTFISPESGERTGMSFLRPRRKGDLERRRRMIKRWADYSSGFLGRTPDYLNSDIMAMASAWKFFAQGGREYGENIKAFFAHVRDNDLLMTHTLINPQANRSLPASSQDDPFLAARIVEKRRDGVVVRGARMLATFPMADEIIVFPSTVIKSGKEDMPYAMAFALPVGTKGLKFLCRESLSHPSRFDHPMSHSFDEQDAVVIFDDVLVPKERIFLLEDPERANALHEATDAVVHMSHQVAVRDSSKTEFFLGLLSSIAETIGIEQFQHVQEKIAKVIMVLETMRSLVIASESEARLNRWGVLTPEFRYLNVARNIYPRLYPSIRETVQQLGASGLMSLPTEGDMQSDVRDYIDRYYVARNAGAEERIRLFRLAWDVAGSSFGSRQELYERFFFGDPVRMAGALYNWYDKEPYKQRIREMLHEW